MLHETMKKINSISNRPKSWKKTIFIRTFEDSFHITDFKPKLVKILLISNYTPTIKILNDKLQTDVKYTKKKLH